MPVSDLARMTWTDARDALARADLAILPIGSTEQHGPHMTLDTDTAIADAFARRLGASIAQEAVLCPVLPLGLAEHHMRFPGTLTLRPETLLALIADVVDSLGAHGVRRVLLVNGHGGNMDGLRLAARQAHRAGKVDVGVVMWAILAADLVAERAVGKWHSHACDIETSVALALAPHIVMPDRIAGPTPQPAARVAAEPGDRVDLPVDFGLWTETGALGDPRLATAELGEEIVALAIDRAKDFVTRFCNETTHAGR